ncbi:MAG TPA: hypothetical protein VF801_07775 [Rhodocyclaceae bacterium]
MAMSAVEVKLTHDPRYQLVEGVSLVIAGAAALGLLALVTMVAGHEGAGYREAIAARGLASRSLLPAMVAFGLAMLLLAGVWTWLVALEVSFRVTGPLFRFCRNLETVIERRRDGPVPIRNTDHLQRHWDEFHGSVTAVRDYYAAMHGMAEELERLVRSGDADAPLLSYAVDILKATAARARC